MMKNLSIHVTAIKNTLKELPKIYITHLNNQESSDDELKGAAKVMHYSRDMQEKIYIMHLNNQEFTNDELKRAAKAMHHSRDIKERIYRS